MVSADSGRAKPSADSFKGDLVDAAIDTAIFAGSMAIGGPVGGKAVNMVIKEGESLVAMGGKAAGKAAEDTAKAVAGAAEKRLATAATKAEEAGAPEAAEAARKAAEHTATNAGVTAAKAGAEAEVKAAQTIDGMGKVAGVAGGGALANQATGEDGLLNKPAIKETNDAVMGVVDDLTGQNEPPAPGRVSSGKIKYPSAEPGSAAAGNGGEGASTAEKGPRGDTITPSGGQTPTSR